MRWLIFLGVVVVAGGQERVPTSAQPMEQGRIVSGIHEEPLQSPIFYESYVPIVLEYKTPKWNKTDIVFNNWYTCVSDTAPYKYSCPVTFHMNQAVVNLHVDFEGLHPIQDEHEQDEVQRVAKDHYERLTQSSEFCSKIQKHFHGIWTHSEDVKEYLSALENCNWSPPVTSEGNSTNWLEPLVERSIGKYNYSIRLPFTRMENNFYSTFYKVITAGLSTNAGGGSGNGSMNSSTSPMFPSALMPQIPNLDLVASALLSNARTTLQGAILGVFYAEKSRWVHANQDCANQLIPQSLVTRAKFNSTLQSLEEKLQKASSEYYESNNENKEYTYDLAIPRGSLSHYYTVPLTDCSHTNDESMFVRILIPIVKKKRGTTMRMVRVHNIPFQYKDHVCRLRISASDSPRGNNHGGGFEDLYNGGGSSGSSPGFFQTPRHYIYDGLNSLAYPTDCKEGQLCKISEYGLIQKNSDPCVSALLGKNRTAVLRSCHFHCSNSKVEDQSHDAPIVTRVHSNAYILTGGVRQYEVKCEGLKMSQIVEVDREKTGSLWVDLPCRCQLIVDKKYIFYGEGKKCDPEELKVYPILPLHFGKVKSKGSAEEVGWGFYADTVDESTFVNLADYLDEERAEGYLRNAVERRQKAEAAKLTVSSGDGGGSSGSVTALWVVFIIVVTILGLLQAYVLYILKRDLRVSYVKDERILYKVPDSPLLHM